MKRFTTSLAIREIQVKLQWANTTYLLEWLTWKIVTAPNAGEDEEKYHSYTIDGNVSTATLKNN